VFRQASPDRQAVAPPGACLRPQSQLNMDTIKIGKPFPETVFRANLGACELLGDTTNYQQQPGAHCAYILGNYCARILGDALYIGGFKKPVAKSSSLPTPNARTPGIHQTRRNGLQSYPSWHYGSWHRAWLFARYPPPPMRRPTLWRIVENSRIKWYRSPLFHYSPLFSTLGIQHLPGGHFFQLFSTIFYYSLLYAE